MRANETGVKQRRNQHSAPLRIERADASAAERCYKIRPPPPRRKREREAKGAARRRLSPACNGEYYGRVRNTLCHNNNEVT
eukprot:scaffold2646_cov31-Tisochrysis_lutea.AAC.2